MTLWLPRGSRMSQVRPGGCPRELVEPASISTMTDGMGSLPGAGRLDRRAGLRTRQGRAAPGWRASSYEVTPSGWVMPRERPADRSQASRCGSRILGQAAPGRVTSARRRAEAGVDLPGDVTLQAADDLRLGLSFFGAAFDVGAGGRV